MQNCIFRKGLVSLVIILFIGIAIAPSVTSIEFSKTKTSNNDDLVEITLQLCKSDGVEDHKMFITQEEDEQLDRLIERFKADLDKAETRDETIEIYNDMVVSLDKLGILPESTNFKEVQELVTGENRISNPEIFGNTNRFCQISGETTRTEVYPYMYNIFACSLLIRLEIFEYITSMIYWYFHGPIFTAFLLLLLFSLILRFRFWLEISENINFPPFGLGGLISIGYTKWDKYEQRNLQYYGKGWIHTLGLFGKKERDGYIRGDIFEISKSNKNHQVGVVGFTGIKINDFYQGTALRVNCIKYGP